MMNDNIRWSEFIKEAPKLFGDKVEIFQTICNSIFKEVENIEFPAVFDNDGVVRLDWETDACRLYIDIYDNCFEWFFIDRKNNHYDGAEGQLQITPKMIGYLHSFVRVVDAAE